MRQFLITRTSDRPARPGDIVILDPGEARHLKTVLRTVTGALLNLTDGRGFRYTGKLLSEQGATPSVEILTCSEDPVESQKPSLVLAVAVVKNKRFEWALEKACELGVHVILPLRTEFGNVQARQGKKQRWRTILTSAVKQCGRSLVPELRETGTLAEVLDNACGPVWFGASPGDERLRSAPVDTFLGEAGVSGRFGAHGEQARELTVCVGPAGGWSPAELALFAEKDALPLHLGPHILRTETAAAAAMVVLQQRREELNRSSEALDR